MAFPPSRRVRMARPSRWRLDLSLLLLPVLMKWNMYHESVGLFTFRSGNDTVEHSACPPPQSLSFLIARATRLHMLQCAELESGRKLQVEAVRYQRASSIKTHSNGKMTVIRTRLPPPGKCLCLSAVMVWTRRLAPGCRSTSCPHHRSPPPVAASGRPRRTPCVRASPNVFLQDVDPVRWW
ncbi:hypothetical protein IE53DRAFT_167402 [Violaceomyces palustris]|uniref:Uncharacterized protein n=1 Tax=Violaceomyces palustris TaxID=1673888 RepID=A0ACD0NT81_9BASI|nr:hypothetical protein IE53DRAFT_167402 [Violaceomyces palustris]